MAGDDGGLSNSSLKKTSSEPMRTNFPSIFRKNPRHQQFFHQPDSADCGDVYNNDDNHCSSSTDEQGSKSTDSQGHQITQADFLAVRPKTKNNHVGAKGKGSASKETATPKTQTGTSNGDTTTRYSYDFLLILQQLGTVTILGK